MSDHYDDQTGFDTSLEPVDPSPWTRPGFLVAAGVVGLIVLLGIGLGVAGLLDDDPADPPAAADPTRTPTTSAPADPDASICGLPGHETSGTLSEPPRNTTWTLVGTIAVPSSEAVGPGVIEDTGLRYCYAHTPEGALMAAAGVYANATASNPVAMVEQTIARGPGFEEALAAAAGAQPGGPASPVQIRGFRLLAYDDDSAMVDLAFEASGRGFFHHPLNLRWDGGDWRLVPNPDGTPPATLPLASLADYIKWSGA